MVRPPTISVIGQAEAMRWLTVMVGSSKGMPRYPCRSCQIQLRYCLQTGSARPYLTMMLCMAAGLITPWVKVNGPPGTECIMAKMAIVARNKVKSSDRSRWTR